MAEVALQLPTSYIPDPASGRPIAAGSVYIGEPDTDPSVLANRVSVVIVQEDGSRVTIAPASQPLSTLAGGVIEYNGSPVTVLVDGVYSLKITDSLNAQKYYVPRQNETANVSTEGNTPANGSFENETQTSGFPDNWKLTAGTNGAIANSTDAVHGLKSLKFTGTDVTGGGVAISDKFDVLSGGNAGVRYSYKSTAVNTLNKIDINWYSAADALISSSPILNEGAANPTTYASFVKSATAPPTAVRAELVLTGIDGTGTTVIGSTFFDGIDIQTSSAGASFDGTETLTNKTLTSPVLTSPVLTSPVLNTSVSGTAVDTDGTLAANSNTLLASQRATKTYVDNKVAGLNTKILTMGDWNMDATVRLDVTHGVTVSKIRSINLTIRDDAGTNIYDYGDQGIQFMITTGLEVQITRLTGGNFDNTSFNSTSYNRGWVTIQYTD